MQTDNSNTLDKSNFGPTDSGTSISPEFASVRAIMTQSCTPCHAFQTQSEAQLIAAGLVVAVQPDNSKMYYRLTGSTGTNGPKNMPQTGTLTAAQIEAFKTWINTLTP